MPRSSKPKRPAITLETGSDPTLWRYDSLEDALAANVNIIAQLMRPEKKSTHQDGPSAKDEDGDRSAPGKAVADERD